MNLTGPFPASAVIAQLRTVTALRLVDGAAGLDAALLDPPRATPAAFVLIEETGTQPGDYAGHYAQPISVTVKVVLWTRHAGGGTQSKGAAEMEQIERAVRSALRDWTPDKPFEPLWLANSGADKAFGSEITRQVIFRTHYRDQEQA